MTQELRIRSRWWYLVPIFYQVIGGIIAYFAIRYDDPKKAKNCLVLGIIISIVQIVIFAIMIQFCPLCDVCPECEEFHQQFFGEI